MTKKKSVEMVRAENLADMLLAAKAGQPRRLIDELEAMRSFLYMWKCDYIQEKESRLALIVGIIGDLVALIEMHFLGENEER